MTRLLIIDDDSLMRELIVSHLSNDYEVIHADGGIKGVALAKQHLPDLVVCDINMPDMDGYAVLDALHGDESTVSLPFIFLSALDRLADMRQGMNLGADDYLTKPFTLEQLSRAVETRLRKKAIREAAHKKTLDEVGQNITISLPHELRTALMVIEGYTHLMLEDSRNSGLDYGPMLNEIAKATTRMHQLSEKFLWYSRLQIVEVDSSLTAMPNEVITRVALAKAESFTRRADLTLDVAVAEVCVPEKSLAKIVEELVENAFKFSTGGTPVNVRAAAVGKKYTITISDAGRGMTSDQIGHIGVFMQFERNLYEQQGTGLGLVIAKQLVERFGGHFSIQSRVQRGTTVTAVLPCHPVEVATNGTSKA